MAVFANRTSGSQSSLREANLARIVEEITRFGGLTQVEIASAARLSTATISNLVRELSDRGLVETRKVVRNGRRAFLVTLVRQTGIGIGMHIGQRSLRIVVGDFTHKVLLAKHLPLPEMHKPDTTMQRGVELIYEMLDSLGTDISEVVGLTAAVSAPIGLETSQIAVPGILPGWDDVDIKGKLSESLNLEVHVENDANMAALAEFRDGAASGIENFVYVWADYEIGGAIVSRGELVRGVTGLAGELGHFQVDPLGMICKCGNRGCLDTVVGAPRLVSLLSITHGDMTFQDLVDNAAGGDPGCMRVISEAAVRIGQAAANLCISTDPEVLVVGGLLTNTGDVFLTPFRETLHRLIFPNALDPIDVIPGTLGKDAPAIGAMIRSLDAAVPAPTAGSSQRSDAGRGDGGA